jgi:hypothetical protein
VSAVDDFEGAGVVVNKSSNRCWPGLSVFDQGLRVRRAAITYTRYQLSVVASDAVELIASAGGWMYDRMRAGWDVSVAVAESPDLRPLQILGVTPLVADQGFDSAVDGLASAAIAIAPEILESNGNVRREVLKALDDGVTEVTFWGAAMPRGLRGRVDRVQHRLSSAARAFKAHSLAAAGIPATAIGATEELYCAAPWYDASRRDPKVMVCCPADR